MADSSAKLIFQGFLAVPSFPPPNSKSSHRTTPSKKKKQPLVTTSSYSVLYLDGRLECYPGDPFCVGSPHEACKPIHTLHLNPFNNWSLISIPAKSPLPYPFTVSRKPPPPTSPTPSQANLTHLGLDVETMGGQLSLAEHNKPKDRKSLKQRIGFGSRHTANKKNELAQPCTQPSSPIFEDSSIPNRLPPPKSASFRTKLGSPTSSISLCSSIHLIDLPNSITFSTHSECSRKQWIDAFIKVFHSASDIELSSSNFLSILQESQLQSPASLSTPRSVNSDSCLHSNSNFLNQSSYSSRTPQHPPSQSTLSQSKTIPETPAQQLYGSVLQTDSPVDLYTLKTRASPPLPSISSHVVTVTPAGSPQKKPPSATPSLTKHVPANSSPSDYCLSPPQLPSSTSPGMNGNSQVKLAEVVPAWIKAVRNADDKRLERDGELNQSETHRQVYTESFSSSKPHPPFDPISRENSLDQAHSRQTSQGPSSHYMSQSLSAPGPISTPTDQYSRRGLENPKPLPTTSMKSFGTSMVQNLKRAGSLTDWPEFSNAGQSILQRMRDNDNQSILSDSLISSSPIITQDPAECSDSNAARTKRAWLLQMVKKNGSGEKPKGGLNSYSSASLLTSTSAPCPPSRTARHGVYMLKGVSSNSSLASSSHQIVASSRESDGQHSLHQVLTPCTDSDPGHRSYPSDQTLPQLPTKLSQSTQRFPPVQSKQAFSEWLSTTSSRAALRLGQSSKNEFGPTHAKSQSLAASPWNNLPLHSSSGSNGFSLPKSNSASNHAPELGPNTSSPDGGLPGSGYHGRSSLETSSSFGPEDLPPPRNHSDSTPTSDRSQSPPSPSPENVVRGPHHLDRAIALSNLSVSYVRDNERSSDFSPSEDINDTSFQGQVNQRIAPEKNFIESDHGHQLLINSQAPSSTGKNRAINLDPSSKENLFKFLASEPPASSTWSNNDRLNKVSGRGRTHTIGALYGESPKGYETNNAMISIPSLPVPPGRRKNNRSLGHTTVVTTQVKTENHYPSSEDGHAPDHLHRPLKESRLKFNSSVGDRSVGDEKSRSSRMKINGSKNITTGIEGDFGR